jgi:hypothetical protein
VITVALTALAVALGWALFGRRRLLARWLVVLGWLAVAALVALAVVFSPGPYELRKFVSYCLMPTGLVWLGLLTLTWFLWRRRQLGFAAAALALWLAYTTAGNVWLGSAIDRKSVV